MATKKYDHRDKKQVEETDGWAARNVWRIVFSGGLTASGIALINWYLSQMSPAAVEAIKKVLGM